MVWKIKIRAFCGVLILMISIASALDSSTPANEDENRVGPKPPGPSEKDGTPDDLEDDTTASTEHEVQRRTDIPLSDSDDALFLEVGEYSTVSFQPYNDRFLGWHTNNPKGYMCYDDYIRCMLYSTIRHPVCAVHKYNYSNYGGARELPSVCDVFLYNCHRGFRYWFVYKYGVCGWRYNYYYPPLTY